MRELSLHILDIVQNSITAGAKLVIINIVEDINLDELVIEIIDNGKGMDDETIKRVMDPFYTTRTTRKVGLGIPLFKNAALTTGGKFYITSRQGSGTIETAVFKHSSIDRQPIGDMSQTMLTLMTGNENIDFLYYHRYVSGEQNDQFIFDTRQIKQVLGGADVNVPEIYMWIKEYIQEGISNLYGGVQ